jgi:secondary thiamine-phosphate synthase enzyme
MHRFGVRTQEREQFVDVTREVDEAVRTLGLQSGAVLVYCPHTTAGIAVNEGYDPDVAADVLGWMSGRVPHRDGYAHAEGNSDSHIKAILTGGSQMVPVERGALALGRWQKVFLAEFDGPRQREVWVSAAGG